MTSDGERIARLEEAVRGVREDVTELVAETNRSRTRLHNPEGFAQAYLDVQRENRRQEKRENEKLSMMIGVGGLAMSLAMVALTVVTIFLHAS